MSALSLVALFGLASVPSASAWGSFGHQTIAYIAQDFVKSETASWVQGILGDTSSAYMANVASWADTYRYSAGGDWSAELHYIDANDNPPDSCDVDYERDCAGDNCIVGAITNYTNQLLDSSISEARQLDALRFVIHFVGDIHQPLHDEALDVGGNSIDVTYDGDDTNLHSVWDTAILEQLAGSDTVRAYAAEETNAINAGTWSTSSWLSGMDISDPQGSALTWASGANGYVCSDVIPDGVSAVESGDLSGTYFDDHSHAIRIQVARGGYRLAAWLDLIATGSTSLG